MHFKFDNRNVSRLRPWAETRLGFPLASPSLPPFATSFNPSDYLPGKNYLPVRSICRTHRLHSSSVHGTLEPRCSATRNALHLFLLHALTGGVAAKRPGYTPTPLHLFPISLSTTKFRWFLSVQPPASSLQPLSRLLATHPKIAPVTPFLATHPKTQVLKAGLYLSRKGWDIIL